MRKEPEGHHSGGHAKTLGEWHPSVLHHVEKQRTPYQRAVKKIVADVFDTHVTPGSTIWEVGAGMGALRELVPTDYTRYISSEYNVLNLISGKANGRKMQSVAASAMALPLPDASVDVVVGLDTYAWLDDLPEAMSEVSRVLGPNGTFIHFQGNVPNVSTVLDDYPDKIFFPTVSNTTNTFKGAAMVGVNRTDIMQRMNFFETPTFDPIYPALLKVFLEDPDQAYTSAAFSPDGEQYLDVINDILGFLPGEKITIPSLPDYFRGKLAKNANKAGLQVVESAYRTESVHVPRNDVQNDDPNVNYFILSYGSVFTGVHPYVASLEDNSVIEDANMGVVVAKKAA